MFSESITPVGSYETDVKGPIRVPYDIVDGKPVFDAEINGIPLRLMIDNGRLWDQIWFFGTPVVDKLGLIQGDSLTIGGAGSGERTEAVSTEGVSITIGDVTFHDQECFISPASAGYTRMFPSVDGQISNTFFSHFQVEFDFEKNVAILHRPDTYEPSENTAILPMTAWEDGGYSIPIKIKLENGTVLDDIIDIDFGGTSLLKLVLDEEKGIVPPEKKLETVLGYGAQGPMTGYLGRVREMTFAGQTFKNELAAFGNRDEMRIEPTSLGVVGLPLLSRFTMVFDYIGQRLYLTPNRFIDRPYDYNMSGMKIAKGYFVKVIMPDSAAEEAGLQIDDKLIEINGTPTNGMSIIDYLDIVSSEHGRKLTLLVQRGDEYITMILTLKRMI